MKILSSVSFKLALAMLLSYSSISAQPEWICNLPPDTVAVPTYRGVDCSRDAESFMDRYAWKENYIPLSDTIPEKQIHVSYHFWQLDDSTGNWQDTIAWEAIFEQIHIWMNDRYRNSNPPTNPPLSYGLPTTELIDSKIEIVVDSMYFYPNSVIYNGNHSGTFLGDWVASNFPEHTDAMMIHFYPYEGSPGGGGFSLGPTSSHPGLVVTRQIDPDSVGPFWLSGHLVHEIGHGLGLGHTYDLGGHWYFNNMWPSDPIVHRQHCDKNSNDFCWDVFDSTLTQSSNPIYYCGFSQCNTCLTAGAYSTDPEFNNNNIMGGEQTNYHISPLQMGIMHRTTVLQDVRDYVSGHSEIPHVVSTDETWDFSMKFYQDILVKTGAELTIQCEIQMSPENKIIVEPGARLIIDGGIVTNERYFNTLWQGIEVLGYPEASQVLSNQGYVHVTNDGVIETPKSA